MRPIMLVALGIAIAGCSLPASEEGSLRRYERNAAGDARWGIQVESAEAGGWGVLGGFGCMGLSVPWTISIGAAGPDGAVGDYTPLLSSADVADPTNAEIWIDVARDGTVTWGEGKPEWAAEDAPSCGPGG